MSKFPLNLQFFAEETPAVAPAATPSAAPAPADFAGALMKALDERLPRAERSVAKSLQDQLGASDDDVKAALEKIKAEKAAKLPETAQKQIDAAKAELQKYKLAAEVSKEGAALGLLDADVAMTLLGEDATKTNDKGEFAGLKAALEKLKETKPYLFGATQKPGAMAQRVSGGGSPGALSPVEERFYSKNPNIRPK